MKKHNRYLRFRPHQPALVVSAAALMLGVSHAATVGFNFQANYCGAASYSGAPVTAQAFGINPESWESLTPMDTGYGCPAAYFMLSELIDSTSAGGGLNPLPQGAVTVSWSAYTANVSGFGGYDRSPPHYTFGGNGHNPGEEEVYWGFLRDGVNFGPGSSGGDNNQPGYSVDIVGLKSLFPNNPFVIELVASADSMEVITNAFIIDATHSTTQSVVYASTPPVGDVGDTAWIRGIGGGLSTSSGSVDSDHVMIVGNRAQHVIPPADHPKSEGLNSGSTLSGFIVTDQPVVTMSPQPVFAAAGDHVTLKAISIGVPPLTYQWRNGGVAVNGATHATYEITSVTGNDAGDYDLVVSNTYGSTTSKVATVTVDRLVIAASSTATIAADSKPSGAPVDGVNFGASWVATDTDAFNITRNGVLQFTATEQDQLVLPGSAAFDASAGTITFWMRSGGDTDPAGHEAMLFDRRTTDGLVIVQALDGKIEVQAGPQATNQLTSTINLSDTIWHLVSVVYDQSAAGTMSLYIDGVLDVSAPNAAAWSWPAGQRIEMALSHDTFWQAYEGLIDDVRIYSRRLVAGEIQTLFNDDSVIDANTLQVRLNFSTAPVQGIGATWQAPGAVLQAADNAAGPYTDLSGATSPYYFSTTAAKRFYRYRHTPASILSNPYDM